MNDFLKEHTSIWSRNRIMRTMKLFQEQGLAWKGALGKDDEANLHFIHNRTEASFIVLPGKQQLDQKQNKAIEDIASHMQQVLQTEYEKIEFEHETMINTQLAINGNAISQTHIAPIYVCFDISCTSWIGTNELAVLLNVFRSVLIPVRLVKIDISSTAVDKAGLILLRNFIAEGHSRTACNLHALNISHLQEVAADDILDFLSFLNNSKDDGQENNNYNILPPLRYLYLGQQYYHKYLGHFIDNVLSELPLVCGDFLEEIFPEEWGNSPPIAYMQSNITESADRFHFKQLAQGLICRNYLFTEKSLHIQKAVPFVKRSNYVRVVFYLTRNMKRVHFEYLNFTRRSILNDPNPSFGSKETSEETIKWIFAWLTQLKHSCDVIILRNCEITDSNVQLISEYFSHDRKTLRCDLSFPKSSGLSNKGLKVLCDGIIGNTHLHTLDLQMHPEISEDGMKYLMKAVQHSHLNSVNLQHTGVDNQSSPEEPQYDSGNFTLNGLHQMIADGQDHQAYLAKIMNKRYKPEAQKVMNLALMPYYKRAIHDPLAPSLDN